MAGPPLPDEGSRAGRAADAQRRRVVRAGGAVYRGGRRLAHGSSRLAVGTGRRLRRASSAGGAGESGLSRVVELHAVHTAGDALLAVSLAGTLFFTVPTDEARGRVALALVLTMAPFALVAPVIGPVLDRFSRGRRWALGASFAARAFCCWIMAEAVVRGDLSLYPAAFACLVASRAYTVTRSAVIPRLLPRGVELVTANARSAAFGVLGATVAGGIGIALSRAGPQWSLRLAFVVYVVGGVLAGLLDKRVDSSAGEEDATGLGVIGGRRGRRRYQVGPAVVRALRANAALRWFSGFMTLFLAFLLRSQPLGGLSPEMTLALGVGAVVVGSTVGTGTMAVLKARRPDAIVTTMLLVAAGAAALGALSWTLATALLVAFAAGLCQQSAKLALDAIVQRDVPERVRTSAFARSETLLQLTWVLGGIIGIAMPLVPWAGLTLSAVALVAVSVLVLQSSPVAARPWAAVRAAGRRGAAGVRRGRPPRRPPRRPPGAPAEEPLRVPAGWDEPSREPEGWDDAPDEPADRPPSSAASGPPASWEPGPPSVPPGSLSDRGRPPPP